MSEMMAERNPLLATPYCAYGLVLGGEESLVAVVLLRSTAHFHGLCVSADGEYRGEGKRCPVLTCY
jgi:hypothetical protein